MRVLVTLLAVLLFASPAFATDHQETAPPPIVVTGYSDIPTTAYVEPAGTWNTVIVITATRDNATYPVLVPAGATTFVAQCTCGVEPVTNELSVSFILPPGTEVPAAITVGYGMPTPIAETGQRFDYLSVGIGILAGALLWSLLVSRGLVQKRKRKQVPATAAHVDAAAEGKETLAARKRVLMAGLKDLEMAKMNKDIEPAVYDRLKAELKAETVVVMRALEQAG